SAARSNASSSSIVILMRPSYTGPTSKPTVLVSALFAKLADDAARVAGGEHARRDVAGDDAAGADHRFGADRYAGADNRAAADPYIRTDRDRLGVFLRPPQLGVQRMGRRVELHRGAEHREVADRHGADVEDHAVEVEEDAVAEVDVGSIIAEEGRLNPGGV